MKIVIRGGHNPSAQGASAVNVGGLDELKEDRLVYVDTITYLKRAQQTVLDGTPGNCSENADLKYGTDIANNSNSDLFVPVHFNKAYDSYKGAIGSEVWINPKNPTAVQIGTRILNNLQALGFKNRGLKDGMNVQHLHDIISCVPTAVLVEVCFCEATEDIAIYRKVGHDALGKALSDGITGRITNSISGQITYPTPAKVTIVPETRVNNSISQLQAELNKQGFGNIAVDGFYGPKTLAACPIVRKGDTGNITKWLQKRLAMSLQDGIFGSGTFNTVVKYQKSVGNGLPSDGIVGHNTWDALLK